MKVYTKAGLGAAPTLLPGWEPCSTLGGGRCTGILISLVWNKVALPLASALSGCSPRGCMHPPQAAGTRGVVPEVQQGRRA